MLSQEILKKVKSIEIASRRLVKQGMAGQYLSAFRGSGMQFREFRNYVYGDDVRHISWTVSARVSDPVIKTFEEDRERTLFLIVDVSASLRRGPWAAAKAELLAKVAATLALSASEANDKLGLLLFSDKVEKLVPPKKGDTHLLRIIRDVLAFEPTGHKTSPSLALRQLDAVLKKHAIVFLLSDMEVLPDDQVLRQTLSKHELIAVGVEHPQESEIPHLGFLELQTAELGRPVTIDTNSTSLMEHIRYFGNKRRQEAVAQFRKSGVDLLWMRTDEDYIPHLQNYFRKRSSKRNSSKV